ncbi:MAG TPA: TIGR03619 family F420-dependent LLM class oxidoreductase [Mycobacteriales bacterium]|nr:TIGR03619 family F420-dependent LLM class oxidoreductase [Mycobacteriales bacterium]
MIRLGINVPNFGPETDMQVLSEWAQFAETGGFAAMVVSDHVAPTAEVTALYPDPFYDPLTLIAWLAGRTERLLFATSVLVVPYRNPLLTARISAMLHEMSRGRFALGVGVGWSPSEFAVVGGDFAARGATTDRYLEVITEAWRSELVTSGGAQVATGPRPDGGHVPLWIGGAAAPAIRRVVRFGSAWHPINPDRGWLREKGIPALRDEAERAGSPVPQIVPRIKFRVTGSAGADRALGVGTLAQIADDVRELFDLGASLVIVDPNPDSPVPRDFAAERDGLAELLAAL